MFLVGFSQAVSKEKWQSKDANEKGLTTSWLSRASDFLFPKRHPSNLAFLLFWQTLLLFLTFSRPRTLIPRVQTRTTDYPLVSLRNFDKFLPLVNRDLSLKQITTATATRMSLNQRLNEKNNCSACTCVENLCWGERDTYVTLSWRFV